VGLYLKGTSCFALLLDFFVRGVLNLAGDIPEEVHEDVGLAGFQLIWKFLSL